MSKPSEAKWARCWLCRGRFHATTEHLAKYGMECLGCAVLTPSETKKDMIELEKRAGDFGISPDASAGFIKQ